jgi:two-component system cell cycle response regulator DivK
VQSITAIPVVALTAYAMPHERDQAIAAGCSGHIEKPIDTRIFNDQVSAFSGRGTGQGNVRA